MTLQHPDGAAVGEAQPLPALPAAEVTLRTGAGMPRAARAAVSGWLEDRVPAGVLVDALLLVSELASNACLHAGQRADAPVRISAGLGARVVRLAVADRGRDGAVERRDPSMNGTGGFGLHLVELLAADWGVTHAEGTEVWFTLALPGLEAS